MDKGSVLVAVKWIVLLSIFFLLLSLVFTGGRYGGRSSREWEQDYRELQERHNKLDDYNKLIFKKLMRLENCNDAYDKENEQYKKHMTVSAYCLIYSE